MQNSISLLFYLKKPKVFTGSAVPIYTRITVDGKRAEISTGRECASEKWNAQAGRSNGTKEEVKFLNNLLDTIQSKLQETHRLMMAAGEIISAETIKKFTDYVFHYLRILINWKYQSNCPFPPKNLSNKSIDFSSADMGQIKMAIWI